MPIVKTAAELLYDHLQRAGVHVHEYCKRPLHGKVAVVDDDWSTVGSSNLDPLSLALNLEANVILRDRAFADCLRSRLQHLIDHECRPAPVPPPSRWSFWPQLRSALVFHFLRHFSTWAGYLPRHAPKLKVAQPPPARRGRADNRGAERRSSPWRARVATEALPTASARARTDARPARACATGLWYPAAKRGAHDPVLRRRAGPGGEPCTKHRLGFRLGRPSRLLGRHAVAGGGLRGGQPCALLRLRPDRPARDRPSAAIAQGGGDRLHVLCLQSESGLVGRWRGAALPALRAPRPAGRNDHEDPGTERPDELARLLLRRRLRVPVRGAGPAARVGARQRRAALARSGTSARRCGLCRPVFPVDAAGVECSRPCAAPAVGPDCGAAARAVGDELDADRRRGVGVAAAQDRLRERARRAAHRRCRGRHRPRSSGSGRARGGVHRAALAPHSPSRAARRAARLSGHLLPDAAGACVGSVHRARGRSEAFAPEAREFDTSI